MKRVHAALTASLIGASLFSGPAVAQEVYDGVTIGELEAALSDGFSVSSDSLSDGSKILFAQGKNHLIGAVLTHCGDSTRCEGVTYFSVIEKKLSADFINDFNRKYDYVKITTSTKGQHGINLELLAAGGVTRTNLTNNAAMLMLRMTQLSEILNSTVSLDTPNRMLTLGADMSVARVQEGFVNSKTSSRPTMAVDPKKIRAVIDLTAERLK
jgi:hypothetical protein